MEYRFNPEDPVIVVYAEIEGKIKVKLRMALDTGATYIMIPWDFAEVLGYMPELLKERVELVTASGVEKAPLITLSSISVLGKKARNIKAIVHDLPQKSYVDGLLGLSYLKNFEVRLDFRKSVLEIV